MLVELRASSSCGSTASTSSSNSSASSSSGMRAFMADSILRRHGGGSAGACSAHRQEIERVDRLAVLANLEMQLVARARAGAHLRDLLTGFDLVAFFDQARAIVAVGRQETGIVFDDDQLTVAEQAVAAVD